MVMLGILIILTVSSLLSIYAFDRGKIDQDSNNRVDSTVQVSEGITIPRNVNDEPNPKLLDANQGFVTVDSDGDIDVSATDAQGDEFRIVMYLQTKSDEDVPVKIATNTTESMSATVESSTTCVKVSDTLYSSYLDASSEYTKVTIIAELDVTATGNQKLEFAIKRSEGSVN